MSLAHRPFDGADELLSRKRCRQSAVEGLNRRDVSAATAGDVDEIAGTQPGLAACEESCQADVFVFDGPDRGDHVVHEGERPIERGETTDRDICVQQFLEDFGRSNSRTCNRHRFEEESLRTIPERMLPTDRIHEHVRVDEDHVSDRPRFRESSMVRR